MVEDGAGRTLATGDLSAAAQDLQYISNMLPFRSGEVVIRSLFTNELLVVPSRRSHGSGSGRSIGICEKRVFDAAVCGGRGDRH